MNVLGLSSNYHDASAAIVRDGEVIAAAAEERFTGQKHDPSFPFQAIRFCLKEAKLAPADLDLVAYHEDPIAKFSRTLSSSFKNFPYSLPTFVKSMREAITSGFWIKSDICKAVDVDLRKVICIPHHMSHAAHAFLGSPYDEAAILTIDAVGEWSATGLFTGRRGHGGEGAQIVPQELVSFPHSLGLVYSAFTAFLGFKANDGECSTMALAAFGRPKYADEIRKVIRVSGSGRYQIDLSYFDFSRDDRLPLTPKFLSAFGAPRSYRAPLAFSSLQDAPADGGAYAEADADQQRFADVAASLQLVLEEAVLAIARRLKAATGLPNLTYAGGVALNCVANSRLASSGIFESVFVPPDPGDGGGAMGAALYASMLRGKARPPGRAISPYLGASYGSARIDATIPHLETENWHRFSRRPLPRLETASLNRRNVERDDELVELIARQLRERKIVGWVRGRFENGPRALGNRSILCQPESVETCARLSSVVKLRAPFRPYACAITEEEASRLLEDYRPSTTLRWMQSSYRVRPEFVANLRGGLHVDFTTRAQICSKAENPVFHRLIEAYHALSGVGALVNTSFNEKGYPIVSSPIHALLMFARTEMDILVVDNLVLSKAPL